jgi:hypothetical protein
MNGDKIRTTIETTEKGMLVIQTSSDREAVAALQQHASGSKRSSPGRHDGDAAAMMKNGGMYSGMMQGVPSGGDVRKSQ